MFVLMLLSLFFISIQHFLSTSTPRLFSKQIKLTETTSTNQLNQYSNRAIIITWLTYQYFLVSLWLIGYIQSESRHHGYNVHNGEVHVKYAVFRRLYEVYGSKWNVAF